MKKTFDAVAHALPHIQALHAYVPGEQPQGAGWVKLNTNENPYPPAPGVAAAIAPEVDQLRLYPEPVSASLRSAIAQRFGLGAGNVIIGNGSDNLLDLIVRCFVSDPGVGHTVPSYSLYPVVAGMSGQQVVEVNFEREMQLDVRAMADTAAGGAGGVGAFPGPRLPAFHARFPVAACLQFIDYIARPAASPT